MFHGIKVNTDLLLYHDTGRYFFFNIYTRSGEKVKIINAYPYKFCNFTKKVAMNIFVAGLPYDLDDAELEEIFEKFGKVNSAKVAMDKETETAVGLVLLKCPWKQRQRKRSRDLIIFRLAKNLS